MKTCSDCGLEKPETDYYAYKNGRLYRRCKPCHYAACRVNLARDPERIRARERARYHAGQRHKKKYEKMLRKYGLTRDAYEALLEKQNGVCAICLKPFGDSYSGGEGSRDGASRWDIPSVDHCHETGRVRGILHRRCNLAIEFMLTEQESKRAAAYLAG